MPVLAFAGDPHDPRGAYALLASYELLYTHDRGLTWERLPFPPAGTGTHVGLTAQNYPLAQPDLVAVSLQPGLLFARAGEVLYRSRDAGQSWKPLLDAVALFAVDYEGDGLYTWRPALPREERGFYVSKDGGETWSQTYRGFFPPALQGEPTQPALEGVLSLAVDPASGNSLFAGTHFGVFHGFDGGATWLETKTGLSPALDGTARAPMLRVVDGELYVLSETEDVSGKRVVFARLAHGQVIPDQDHWVEVGGPDLSRHTASAYPGFYGVYDLADHNGILYMASYTGMLASRDRGEHWDTLPGAQGAVHRLGLNPRQLYAWTEGGLRTLFMLTEDARPPALPALPPVTGEVDLRLLGSTGGAFNNFAVLEELAVLGVGIRLEVFRLDEPTGPRLLGRSGLLPGVPATLAAVKGHIYVAIPNSGLLVFDLSDPSRPQELSQLELPFAPQDMQLREGRLYVSGGTCQSTGCSGGMAIVDITDPGRPRLTGTLASPTQTVRTVLAGRNAYLYEQACGSRDCVYSLRVVDLASPTRPSQLAQVEVPGPLVSLDLLGDRLLLAHDAGLLVFDVSRPQHPQQTGRLAMHTQLFLSHGQVGYAIDWDGVITVIDLSDPDRPRRGSRLPPREVFLGYITSAVIRDQSLYMSGSEGEFGYCWTGLHVFDLSQPASPRQISTAENTLAFACARELTLSGNWMVLADLEGLHFVDLTTPSRPGLYGSLGTASQYAHLTVWDEHLFASSGLASDSLLVIDVRDPAEPVLHGPFPFGYAWGTVQDGRYLYIPSWDGGLVVADITDPTRPRTTGGLGADRLAGYAYRVALDRQRMVIALGDAGTRILDISDPRKPIVLGSLDLLVGDNYIGADWLAAQGGYIYTVTNLPSGADWPTPYLVVVDARNPSDPVRVNQLALPGGLSPVALHIKDGRLLLAANLCPPGKSGCFGRFSTYDLSEPVEPLQTSTLEFPFELKAMTEGDELAYLSAEPDRLLAVDLSDPHRSSLAAIIQLPGCSGNLATEGRRLYVAACEAGLLILELVN